MAPARKARLAFIALVLVVACGLGARSAPPAVASGTTPPTSVAPPTTIAGIAGRLPPAPSTVPFRTRAQSARVDPLLAKLSLGGFALFLLLVATQVVLTRPGRRGRRTL